MQRKLNEEFIKEYSRRFSENISSDFFQEKETINGKEILNITPSRQVNFFVLKILFGNWQNEMKKLESPYFNYRDPEVRRAMVDFMNILSQKIEIDEDHFYELLQEAVNDSLTLTVLPQKFLYDELIQKDITTVNGKITRPLLKYLKVHREYFEKFFEENSGEDLSVFLDKSREFFEGVDVQPAAEEELERLSAVREITLQQLLDTDADTGEKMAEEKEDPDDFSTLGPDFSDMDEADISEEDEDTYEKTRAPQEGPVRFEEESYEDEASPQETKQGADTGEEDPANEEEIMSSKPDYADEDEEMLNFSTEERASGAEAGIYNTELENTFGDDPSRDPTEDFTIAKEGLVSEEEPIEEVEAKQKELLHEEEEKKAADDDLDTSEDEPEQDGPLNQKFSQESTTINDRYANEQKFTIADNLEKKKVNSIMDAISVNHRYMFTKELFDGDRDEFVYAISKVDQSGSFDDAVEMLVEDYAKEKSWDMNSEEVKELLKVVFRKFR